MIAMKSLMSTWKFVTSSGKGAGRRMRSFVTLPRDCLAIPVEFMRFCTTENTLPYLVTIFPEPSPQRTPVSRPHVEARKRFCGAERRVCLCCGSVQESSQGVEFRDIRQRAASFGRDPASLLFFNLFTVIVAPTESEAKAKHDEYRSYVSYDGALALVSGEFGIDFGKYHPDDRIEYIENDAVQSATESLTTSDPDKIWTVREVANWVGIGGLGPLVVGSPGQVADAMQGWVDETDVDGFNLAYAVTHESFRDFVDLVVPELQRRGIYKKEYRPGTLREKLFARALICTRSIRVPIESAKSKAR